MDTGNYQSLSGSLMDSDDHENREVHTLLSELFRLPEAVSNRGRDRALGVPLLLYPLEKDRVFHMTDLGMLNK